MSRREDLVRFYELLDELTHQAGGLRTLDSLSLHSDWPQRGVYLFFDPNEVRSDSGLGPRVVRVGTHALTHGSRSTLRQRLAQHSGASSGSGNHRGSIFRSLVGQALLAHGDVPDCVSWGVKSSKGQAMLALGLQSSDLDAKERPVEHAVSAYLADLPFLWLDISDEPSTDSERGVLERNAIGLLSNFNRSTLDPASSRWLGHHSNRKLVRESGLWNNRHVNDVYDPSFLGILERQLKH